MSIINNNRVKDEIVSFLRNSDLLTISQRGVTTQTDSFVATAGQTVFTLTKNNLRNVRSVTVNSVAISGFLDYVPNFVAGAGTVTLTTASTLSDAVVVVYDYSSGTVEAVWDDTPDFGNPSIKIDNFPRIGMEVVSKRIKMIGIGAPNWLSDVMVTVHFYSKTKRELDDLITALRTAVKANQKNFKTYKLVHPSTESPLIDHKELASKVKEKTVDLIMQFGFES